MEERVLAWLRALGRGPFTCQELADGTGLSRDQALITLLALTRRGLIEAVQWMGDYGTGRYELRRA